VGEIVKTRQKERPSHSDIFDRLNRLLGSEAEVVVKQVVALMDANDAESALAALKAYDAKIGGTGLHEAKEDEMLPGVYRPIWYVQMFFRHPESQHLSRYIISTVCAHVESILKRMILWGIVEGTGSLMPMGRIVALVKHRLPSALGEDLQWLSSRVYNCVKHDFDFSDHPDLQSREHFFDLDESIAIYLIARRLAVDLEQISGKSQAFRR